MLSIVSIRLGSAMPDINVVLFGRSQRIQIAGFRCLIFDFRYLAIEVCCLLFWPAT